MINNINQSPYCDQGEKMNNDLMFSSNNQQWATRSEVYNQIKEYSGFLSI